MGRNLEILPDMLTVEDVDIIPEDILGELMVLNDSTINSYFTNFIKRFGQSDDEQYQRVSIKLSSILDEYKEKRDFINGQYMYDTYRIIQKLNISDIDYKTNPDVLMDYEQRLKEVIDNEHIIIQMKEDTIDNIMARMNEKAGTTDDEEIIMTVFRLTQSLSRNRKIFSPNNSSEISALEKALKYRNKIEEVLVTLKDVKVLQKLGHEGTDPRVWRQL